MKVIHVKRDPNELAAAVRAKRYVYIGRGAGGTVGLFGNPFVIGRDGDREWVIRKYEDYIRKQPERLELIRLWKPDMVLGCWCRSVKDIVNPNACHGDVLMQIWHEMHDLRLEA